MSDFTKLRQEAFTKFVASCEARSFHIKERRRQLDEEERHLERIRREGEAWIKSVPDELLPFFMQGGNVLEVEKVEQPHVQNGSDASGKSDSPFPVRETIRNFLKEQDRGTKVSTPFVYDEMSKRHEWFRNHRNKDKLRAQIGGTLSFLAEEGLLKLYKERQGRYPAIYLTVEEKDPLVD